MEPHAPATPPPGGDSPSSASPPPLSPSVIKVKRVTEEESISRRGSGAELLVGHTKTFPRISFPRNEYRFRVFDRAKKKLVIVMVGLPAVGKSFIARGLARYFSWQGLNCMCFNIGNYRRTRYPGAKRVPGNFQGADFFETGNAEATAIREQLADEVLQDLIHWLLNMDGNIAIFDGTNSTVERRDRILKQCSTHPGLNVIFVESIVNDPDIIHHAVLHTKAHSPDYEGIDPEEAVADFLQRIAHYRDRYETLTDDSLMYLKFIDRGEKLVMNRINGYYESRLVFFLMNTRLTDRPIYVCRHGESEANRDGKLGLDMPLTAKGQQFAQALSSFISSYHAPGEVQIWTSALKRTIQTAAPLQKIGYTTREWRSLNEINAGQCEGMTYEEVKEKYPEDYAFRKQNKRNFRYPGPNGESYNDVVARIDPVILEMGRVEKPLLLVCHQAVLRMVLAYLLEIDLDRATELPIPLHHVIVVRPNAYGSSTSEYSLLDDGDGEPLSYHGGVSVGAGGTKGEAGGKGKR